MLSKAAK